MGDKSELKVNGTCRRPVIVRRHTPRTPHTGRLRLIAAIFIFAFIISSVPFVGADRSNSEFSFKLVGDLKGEVVDNGTLAPVDNVTILGEVHSRVLSFKIQLNSDHYSYWIFDKETKTLLCSRENLRVTPGCFSLPLDNYLESGSHTFALTAWAPGYKSVAMSGEYCVGDPSNNSFLTIELERDNDNGTSGLSLTVTPGEADVTRRQAQVQSGTQSVSLTDYQSSRRSDGSPVYGSSTPRWSSSTSLVSPEQYNANTSSYQKVSTTTGLTSVQAGYSVPIYGWQKTGVETVTLAADTSVAVRVAYAIMGYTVAEKYTNWTNIYCLSKTDGTWKDTGKTVECWWPNRGAPAASSGYRWVKTCDGWISTFYKEQYNAVEYFKAQGYTITATSTEYSASKRIPRLDGYTATKDVYGWASTGSQQVGMDAGSRDLFSVNSEGTAQMKYAYSEKTARYESRSSTMYSVRTLDGYDRAIVGYDVPVYTQGWTSDPVNATVALVGNFSSSVRLEVQAPAGIEATLSQADLNLEAGEQVQVGLRVSVNSSEPMVGTRTITVWAIDESGQSVEGTLMLRIGAVFGSSSNFSGSHTVSDQFGDVESPLVLTDESGAVTITNHIKGLMETITANAFLSVDCPVNYDGGVEVGAKIRYICSASGYPPMVDGERGGYRYLINVGLSASGAESNETLQEYPTASELFQVNVDLGEIFKKILGFGWDTLSTVTGSKFLSCLLYATNIGDYTRNIINQMNTTGVNAEELRTQIERLASEYGDQELLSSNLSVRTTVSGNCVIPITIDFSASTSLVDGHGWAKSDGESYAFIIAYVEELSLRPV